MDKLVSATLPRGLVPPVVMEFPGITTGGGFAGTAGESSSFKHGFFDECVESVEMVLGNGDVVTAARGGDRDDLFRGAAGAVGTLGVTTLLELKLVEAKKFVKTSYHRTSSVGEAIAKVREQTQLPENDYVDGILFSKDHGVVITGSMTDEKPSETKARTFSGSWDPWFYMHVKEATAMAAGGLATTDSSKPTAFTDYIPLAEYLFRYDRAGFWVGAAGFQYFKGVPFNRLTRWFLDDFVHTRMLYRALHGSGESARFVVQDLALPYANAEAFVDYTAEEFGIWPLWLCPLKPTPPPTFHPHTGEAASTATAVATDRGKSPPGEMLNIGLWGWGPASLTEFVAKNRDLEDELVKLGGRKWLYAHTYYSEKEFWQVYNRSWYERLRDKYHATTLPTVYDKVKVDVEKRRREGSGWRSSLMRMKPLGGLYGIWKSIQSGDYHLHRRAQWKYKDEK